MSSGQSLKRRGKWRASGINLVLTMLINSYIILLEGGIMKKPAVLNLLAILVLFASQRIVVFEEFTVVSG